MQRKNLLRRIHGGAVLENVDFPISKGDSLPLSNLQEALAKSASEFVDNNDILFLGPGTTMQQLARQLRHYTNLTVLTNSLAVINELAGSKVALYALGGLIDPDEQTMYGDIPCSILEQFFATKAFISCGGASFDGVSDYNSDSKLLSLMLKHARKHYLVAASNKFGTNSFCKVCDLQDFDAIITDNLLSDEYRDYIVQLQAELRLVQI